MDYGSLLPGQTVSERSYHLDPSTVETYLRAIGEAPPTDSSDNERQGQVAPPMSVAALGLRGVIQDLKIPEGTLHTAQEVEFRRAIDVGTLLHCQATLSQNSVRGGRRFIVVNLEVEDTNHNIVLTGKSTLVMPLQLLSKKEQR